jgi:hypothetical protein
MAAHITMICERCHQPIMSDEAHSMDGDRRHWPKCQGEETTDE